MVANVATADGSFTHSVAYSPDGTLVAAGHGNGTVALVDSGSASSILAFQAHSAAVPIRGISFSPTSDLIATAADDALVRVFDVRSGTVVHSLVGHRAMAVCVAFAASGSHIVSGGGDGTAICWDWRQREAAHTFALNTEFCWDVCFSPDGRVVAAVTDNGALTILSIAKNGS